MKTTTKIPASAIHQQVDRICSSAELGTKRQLCRLFKYIVDETLEGRSEQLKGYTIGLEVFMLGEDFDPERNPIVRIHAGRLRRMLRLYYLEEGKHDRIKIEIPKGKYIPYFCDENQTLESANPSSLDLDEVADSKSVKLKSTDIKAGIAVLPFKNLSGSPDKEYLALGFAEELSVELIKYDDLVVLDPVLLMGSEKPQLSVKDFGKGLEFSYVIEGSIQMSNDRLKILVKLIDLDQGQRIWADRFVREFNSVDISNALENIAHQVSGIIGSEYGIILGSISSKFDRNLPQSASSFSAILKYYHFEATHSPESFRSAFEALGQALKAEPDSGMIKALLASMYGIRYMLDLDGAADAYKKMGVLAEKALSLDPNNVTVRIIYTFKCLAYNEKQRFLKEATTCLSKCSNSALRLVALGLYLSLYGEWEQGMQVLKRVKDMGINYPKIIFGATCLYYYRKKEYSRALDEANQYTLPSMFWGPMLRIAVLGQLERLDEVGTHIDHLKQLKPDFENQAFYLLTRYVKEEDLAVHVVEGLRKAGMEIPS